jgi:diguanylate cyclase (GGDEF)-like protein
MDEPVELKDEPYKATLSMGIALYPSHANSRKDLIEIADQAMYEAKETGRGSGRSNYFMAGNSAAA